MPVERAADRAHPAAADAARGTSTATARGDDGWTLVDTGLGLGETPWDGARRDRRSRIVITHLHPDHVGGARRPRPATGARVHQGALDYEQCEHVWGNDDWPRADRRLVPAARRAAARSRDELIESGPRLRAVRPLRARPGAARRRATTSTAGRCSRCRATRTGTSRSIRDGVLIAGDHLLPGSRRRSASTPRAGPTRSATTSTRSSGRSSSRRASRYRGHGEPIERPAGARARDHRAPPRAARRDGRRARAGAAHAATRSRSRSSAPSSARRSAASPSPRRSRTSSGSSREGRAARARGRPDRLLYCAVAWTTSCRLVPAPRRAGRDDSFLELLAVGVLILLNALLRRGRVRARHRAPDAHHRARTTRATAARATCCGSRATRRGSSPRCSSASRSRSLAIGALGEPALANASTP